MRVRLGLSLLFLVCGLAVITPTAIAAPVEFSITMGENWDSGLTLEGDQLTSLALTAFVDSCEAQNREGWGIGLPATAVSLSGNALHLETDGTDQGYPGSSIHAAIDGTLAADRRSITGTVTLSDMESPATSGCPPITRTFYAVVRPASVPPDPEHQWTYSGARLDVDATPGHITRMRANVPMACGDSVNAITFDTRAYAVDDIPVAGDGSFSRTLYVLDEYAIVRELTITGTVGSAGVSARFQVASPAQTGAFLKGCAGDATFSAPPPGTAAAPPGAAPVTRLPSSTLTNTKAPPTAIVGHQSLPRRSGPSAIFDWAELRLSRGAAYSYYFLVDKLHCLNHATHVRIVALGHAHRVRCGRSRGFASGPLPAGTDYRLTAQAIRVRRGRIVGRGSVVMTLLHMRAADYGWVPITHLPGTPPKV